MTAPTLIPRSDVIKFFASWRTELDIRQKELYSRLLGGAMGGIATIVLSAGLALDKLGQAPTLVRVTLGLTLFLLLLGAGNIMNCFVLAVNGQIELLRAERNISIDSSDTVPASELATVDANLAQALVQVQKFYAYSYFCIVLAVLAGAITFLIMLVRA